MTISLEKLVQMSAIDFVVKVLQIGGVVRVIAGEKSYFIESVNSEVKVPKGFRTAHSSYKVEIVLKDIASSNTILINLEDK